MSLKFLSICASSITFLFLGLVIQHSEVYGDPTEACQKRNQSYFISDSKQCDKFYECVKAGDLIERMCDDGFVFSEPIRQCDYPHNADCSKRPELQPTRSTDVNCERSNGFYPFPAEQSCQKFYHCLEGVAYEKTCPEGIIFDVGKGTCMHPDLSSRKECSAASVLNFNCPNMNKKFSKLKFGDHDRHAHPTDCRKFFICLMDGKPRLGGCPIGKVFNPKSGFCDYPKNVLECKDYYGKKMLQEGKHSIYDMEALDKLENEENKSASNSEEETFDENLLANAKQSKLVNSKDAKSPKGNTL